MTKYFDLTEEEKLKVYNKAIELNKKRKFGYRLISRAIKSTHKIIVPESTIANWLYNNRIPGRNQLTQFKSKAIPTKKLLKKLYLKENKSREEIAHIFHVTNVTVRKWLENYKIPLRDKKQAMNTQRVKSILRELKLIKPVKNFRGLTKEKAYILGVLCGDGYISKNFIQLEINKNDEEFMKEFIKCFKKVYGVKFNYHFRPKRNTLATYISPEFICNDLLSFGTFGVRKWRVPKSILKSKNETIISSFLRGFFDSEGCVARNFITFSSVNKKGALDVVKLLEKLGVNTSFKEYLKFFENYSTYVYSVFIYGKENIMRFKNIVNFTLSRKREKLDKMYEN